MSEGGLFPWKLQKLKLGRGPPGDYSKLQKPLPKPPPGKDWHQDAETKEWRLLDNSAAKKKKEIGPNHGGEQTLVTEGQQQEAKAPAVVDCLPTERGSSGSSSQHNNNNSSSSSNSNKEDEWELLSDRGAGGTSVSSPHVLVARAGSVRSIASMEDGDGDVSSLSHRSNSNKSVPFKIQRTHSSSTIDSCDNALGPSGKGVLGVDYVEHVILPTDTLQGICLAYKINSTKLRQANHFSGSSLLLAPKKLVIPLSKKALRSGYIRAQDTDAKEYKLHFFLAEFSDLSMTEAKAYLELSDWNLKDAIQSAKEDRDWEEMDSCSLKSGEIRIRMTMKGGVPVGYSAQGAGIPPRGQVQTQEKTSDEDKKEKTEKSAKVTAYEDIPAIATKTVKAGDVYKAASQHDNCGFELKPISAKKEEEQHG